MENTLKLANGNVLVLSVSDVRVSQLASSVHAERYMVEARSNAAAEELAGEYRAWGAKAVVDEQWVEVSA